MNLKAIRFKNSIEKMISVNLIQFVQHITIHYFIL